MLYVIGLGPGKEELMSQEALEAIKDCEIIVGYSTYMRLIKDLVKDKEMVATGMRHEIERCQKLEKMLGSFRVGMPVSMGWLV